MAISDLSEGLSNAVETVGPAVARVQGGRRQSSSGIVWAPGLVVTSLHSLESGEELRVTLGAAAEHKATLKGTDPGLDLALLQFDGAVGSPPRFDDGAGLKVGQLVLSLGRPGRTVRATAGIVSALGHEPWRTRWGAEVSRYLETDAAHRPGFSGGPLVSIDGAVLGLNTTALMRGTPLALPVSTLRKAVESLLAHGRVRRGYLGLSSQPVRLPQEVRQRTGEEIGLLVLDVEPGGPSARAGVAFGDTVLRLGGDEVKDFADLQAFLRADHVGETVPVQVLRAGQVVDLSLTIGERP